MAAGLARDRPGKNKKKKQDARADLIGLEKGREEEDEAWEAQLDGLAEQD